MRSIHTRTCHICEANCGILVELEGANVLSIKGDADDVLSRGHICPKAIAIADLQTDPDRLRTPMKRLGAEWHCISWQQACNEIAERFVGIRTRGGAGALYVGNPTAHNYSVGAQLGPLKKALGARAIYSASTVDQIPHQLVQLWMFGHNSLFPIPDIDRTQTMLIIGGNPAASNGSVWTVPDVKQRIRDLQARGGSLIVIDPRRTETADLASEHHFIRPGTDPALLIALIRTLDEEGLIAPGRLAPMLEGFDSAIEALRRFDMAALAARTGIAEDSIRSIARRIASGPAIVYGRMGVSVSEFGTLNHWLIQLLNIATGNLDREGGMMFSTPGVDVVAATGAGSYGRFRSRVSGLNEVMGELPVVTMAEEIVTPGEGQIRALVTVAGNPVLSCPEGQALDAALETLDLMVSVDMYITATTRHAHYILPPCGPLQKDHYPLFLGAIAIRNYAKYSPALLPMGDDKSDWEIVSDLSRALLQAQGQPAPNTRHPREMLDHMLRQSGHDLTLEKVEAAPHGIDLGPLQPDRLPERLRTPGKTIKCAPELVIADLERFAEALAQHRADSLLLIGRRHLRSNNSWLHNSKRLLKGPERCTLMIHPDDAGARGIKNGNAVTITSRVGRIEAPAEITDAVMPGTVSLPHGFGHGREGVRLSVAQTRPGVSLNDITDRQRFDPVSGNAALNGTPVEVVAA